MTIPLAVWVAKNMQVYLFIDCSSSLAVQKVSILVDTVAAYAVDITLIQFVFCVEICMPPTTQPPNRRYPHSLSTL